MRCGRTWPRIELFPEHARSLTGLADALAEDGDARGGELARSRAEAWIEALRRGGRETEAAVADALLLTTRGRHTQAIASLERLLDAQEPSFVGWTLPVEPLLRPLAGCPAFVAVLGRLAERAR